MQHVKYQRTYHLPYSPGVSSDDKMLHNLDHFYNQEVVIQEKLDGENTTMYRDGIHARSLSSSYHPSQAWVKKLHAEIAHQIPNDIRIVGENVYAVHSLKYTKLKSYFLVFGVYNNDICFSWDDTKNFCEKLGLETVPVLERGIFINPSYGEKCKGVRSTARVGEAEGFVVRLASSFPAQETHNIAKWVRKDHVTTDIHWKNQKLEVNELSLDNLT